MQMSRYQHRMIRNSSQENKSPSRGFLSSLLPHTNTIATDSDIFLFRLVSHGMFEKEKEKEKEKKRRRRRRRKRER